MTEKKLTNEAGLDMPPTLLDLYKAGSMTDVTLVTGDGSTLASHKIVLVTTSHFFHAMINGTGLDMKDGGSPVIHLPNICAEILSIAVHASYLTAMSQPLETAFPTACDRLPCHENNSSWYPDREAQHCGNTPGMMDQSDQLCVSVLETANYLQMPKLIDFCERCLLAKITVEKALFAYEVAFRCGSESLKAQLMTYLNRVWSEFIVRCHHEIQAAPLDVILQILSDDNLDISNEDEILQVVVIWAAGDPLHRRQYLQILIRSVRLQGAAYERALTSVLNTLAEGGYEGATNTSRAGLSGFGWSYDDFMKPHHEYVPRGNIPTRIFVAGGVDSAWRPLKMVEIYDVARDEWNFGAKMPHATGFADGVRIGEDVFVLEGSKFSLNMEMYNRKTKSWRTGVSLQNSRIMPVTVAYQNQVYVFGGRERANEVTNSVVVYTPDCKHWEKKESAIIARCAHAAVLHKGSVFISGGQDSRSITLDFVERYTVPSGGAGQAVREMHPNVLTARKYHGMASAGGRLYVMGGIGRGRTRLDTVEVYDDRCSSWQRSPKLPCSLSSFSTSVVNNEIFVIGGKNNTSNGEEIAGNSVYCYSTTGGKWRACSSLHIERTGHCAVPI